MTPRCPLCGGVVVGAHVHGIDPEQRCDACDTLADLRGAAVCACSLADLRRALAERAASEAERVREAVAREREACAVLCETWTDVYPGASYARGCAARIRARATSPAPAPTARRVLVVDDGAEVRRAALAALLDDPAPEPVADAARRGEEQAKAYLERIGATRAEAVDLDANTLALAYGIDEPAPEPVAAERAVIEALTEAVRAIEFAPAFLYAIGCPWCGRTRREGHTGECVAARALAAARKGG